MPFTAEISSAMVGQNHDGVKFSWHWRVLYTCGSFTGLVSFVPNSTRWNRLFHNFLPRQWYFSCNFTEETALPLVWISIINDIIRNVILLPESITTSMYTRYFNRWIFLFRVIDTRMARLFVILMGIGFYFTTASKVKKIFDLLATLIRDIHLV